MSKSLKFEFPDGSIQKNPPKYATYVVQGSSFKTHRYVGSAKQSLMNRACGWKYPESGNYRDGYRVFNESYVLEWVISPEGNGAWYILYFVEDDTKWEELPWVNEFESIRWVDNPNFKSGLETPDEEQWIKEVRKYHKVVPMSMEEYAKWRIAVDREYRMHNSEDEYPVF